MTVQELIALLSAAPDRDVQVYVFCHGDLMVVQEVEYDDGKSDDPQDWFPVAGVIISVTDGVA